MGVCASRGGEAQFHQLYELDEAHVLGEGSYAVVYRGRHRASGEDVAIKRIDKRASAASAFWEDEVALLRLCARHANVIELRFVCETATHVLLVTELAAGGELFQALINEGAYSEWDAKRFTHDIFEALRFLHAQNIVHRDIKPENLLLTSSDTKQAHIKIGDFGTAKIVNGTSLFGSEHLTWAYCAPEILREIRQQKQQALRSATDSDADAGAGASGASPQATAAAARALNPSASFKSDVWSVGIVLYVLLSGTHPFDPDGRQTKEQMIGNILLGRIALREPLWDDVSAEAKAFLQLLLHPDAAQRPSAEAALSHAWFQDPNTPRLALQVSVSDGLGQYHRLMQKKFRTSVMVAVAAQTLRRSLKRVRNSKTETSKAVDSATATTTSEGSAVAAALSDAAVLHSAARDGEDLATHRTGKKEDKDSSGENSLQRQSSAVSKLFQSHSDPAGNAAGSDSVRPSIDLIDEFDGDTLRPAEPLAARDG